MPPAGAGANAEEFYKKTRMTIVVGSEEGGSLSLYARLVRSTLRIHPGSPNIIVQNIPGASGLVAANTFANRLPRDGSTIRLPHKDTVLAQMLETDKGEVRHPPSVDRRMVDYPAVLIVKAATGVRTFDDLKKRPIHIAASGRTSQGNLAVYLMNQSSAEARVRAGYRGGPSLYLAMERGETEARLVPMDSLALQRPDWIKRNYINIIAQESLVRRGSNAAADR